MCVQHVSWILPAMICRHISWTEVICAAVFPLKDISCPSARVGTRLWPFVMQKHRAWATESVLCVAQCITSWHRLLTARDLLLFSCTDALMDLLQSPASQQRWKLRTAVNVTHACRCAADWCDTTLCIPAFQHNVRSYMFKPIRVNTHESIYNHVVVDAWRLVLLYSVS